MRALGRVGQGVLTRAFVQFVDGIDHAATANLEGVTDGQPTRRQIRFMICGSYFRMPLASGCSAPPLLRRRCAPC